MKKLFILSAVFATMTLASCSEDNTFNPDIHYVESVPEPEIIYNQELIEAFEKLDSLNAIAPDQICEQ